MAKLFIKDRRDRLIEEYIANGFCNVYRAALRAGYAKTTARAQGRRILEVAFNRFIQKGMR